MNDAVRTELREPVGASAPQGPLAGWTATLEMASVQPRVDGGIHLVIELANGTGEKGELMNPLDFLVAGISVSDPTGQRVELPPAAPRLLIHTGGPDRNRFNLPFRLEFVELNGRYLPEAEIEQKTVVVSPWGKVRIGIAVDRIVPQGAGIAAEPAPIPTGEYRVQVSVTLMSPRESQASREVQTPSVAVTLGRR